jgi:hypothetical protein
MMEASRSLVQFRVELERESLGAAWVRKFGMEAAGSPMPRLCCLLLEFR